MKLEPKIQLLKFCSALFNSIFLVLGLSICGCGIWILFNHESFLSILSSVELNTLALGLLVIGGVVMTVSVVGCVAVDREHRFLLLTYLGFLIVLILSQLFVLLLLLITRTKIEQTLDDVVDHTILHYGQNSADRLMDNVQHYGACCGRTAPTDWLENSYIQSLNLTGLDVLPCSCFSWNQPSWNSSWCSELLNFTEPLYGRGNHSYDEGCKQKLSDWLHENGLTVIAMDLSLILIQIGQFVVAFCLYQAFGRKASLKRTNHMTKIGHTHLDNTLEEDLDSGNQNYAYIHPDDACKDPVHPSQ
ncbi:CD82 antigen [Mastacembelus armatus]|uniref:Tetraspanin n=1 Tax=Mastacembelus armatus TaxID=205130 RepID=A0A3Q3ME88_9TELE|nr:CD82 antigen-like [Mastacembelus armatus]